MVRALHEAGIEVILDVVYNHTAEGNHLGPTLSLPGHRQPAVLPAGRGRQAVLHGLHRHREHPQRPRHPQSLQLIMDSLRYWVTEMHVDGFRFDLASTPGPRVPRGRPAVARSSTWCHQDPVVSQVKLIAEPWDIGDGGYQVGNFPRAVDRVERQVPRHRPRLLARRGRPRSASSPAGITGSADLYQHSGRRPVASINFVTAHDGFTLNDLVSYNEKHNEANGEDNNDGESHNRSWNCGVEGPTDDPEILAAARAAAAQLHRHADAQPGRADAAARRRAGPHPGRQQQRLLPGLRAHLDRLGRTSTRACSSSPSR